MLTSRALIFFAPLLVGINSSAAPAATTCSTVAACIFGQNTAAGIGIEGTSASGHGVQGMSSTGFGVVGVTNAKSTSANAAKAGVEGLDGSSNKSPFNSGVYGQSARGFGVYGAATADGAGVRGASASGYGVAGVTAANSTGASNAKAGVAGSDGSTNGSTFNSGVSGTSNHGLGVNGATIDGVGVNGAASGHESGIGVLGVSTFSQYPYHNGGTGVEGDSYFGYGVVGTNAGGTIAHNEMTADFRAGVFGSGTHGVEGVANGTGGGYAAEAGVIGFAGLGSTGLAGYTTSAADIFEGLSAYPPGQQIYYVVARIDYAGNEYLAGRLTTGVTPYVVTKSATGPDVASYGARSASPTLEDYGKASLRQGMAYVALEPVFASTIERSNYMVFLTPEGDSHSLYTTQTPNGFQVRESGGGRSSLTFDYRIVAKPFDTKAGRLPAMSTLERAKRVPRPSMQPNVLRKPR